MKRLVGKTPSITAGNLATIVYNFRRFQECHTGPRPEGSGISQVPVAGGGECLFAVIRYLQEQEGHQPAHHILNLPANRAEAKSFPDCTGYPDLPKVRVCHQSCAGGLTGNVFRPRAQFGQPPVLANPLVVTRDRNLFSMDAAESAGRCPGTRA